MKILYSKFNRNRLPSFQLKTSIIKDNGEIYVEKQALHEDAFFHISNIYNSYVSMQSKYQNVKFVPTIKLGEDRLRFDYIEGITMDALLLDSIRTQDIKQFLEYLREYTCFLKSFGTISISDFIVDDEFARVFGCYPKFENVECFMETNVDLTFDNILIHGSEKIVIDFEWCFNTRVPVDYIVFRSLSRLYWKYGEYLRGFLEIEDAYKILGIYNVTQFEEMEKGFQSFVLGERQCEISSSYRRKLTKLTELINQLNDNRDKLKRNEVILSSSFMENEELTKEYYLLKMQMIEIDKKLTHAQFQSEEYRNKIHYLEEVNKTLETTKQQFEKEIEILNKSEIKENSLIINKLNELIELERGWRGKLAGRVLGRRYFAIGEELGNSNKLRIETFQSELIDVKNEELNKLKIRLNEMELRLGQIEQNKLSEQLDNNHLKTHLNEILAKHHNLDILYKDLAQQNHESTIKNKELQDAYNYIQNEYHQLKYQNESLLKHMYKSLRKEGKH